VPNLDINGERGSFLSLFDRYCIAYRWLMIFSAIGVAANLWHGNKAVAAMFAVAALLSLLFQLVLAYFYEQYLQTKYNATVTSGNYTEVRRTVVLLLALFFILLVPRPLLVQVVRVILRALLTRFLQHPILVHLLR
jgi:uncharacterized membrane protein